MNVFGELDRAMVIGYLKEANSDDPDVIRGRYMGLSSQIELYRNLLLIPLVLGSIQIAVGIVGLIIVIGIFLIFIGCGFAGVAWWLRKRMAQNLLVAGAAYQEYTTQIGVRSA